MIGRNRTNSHQVVGWLAGPVQVAAHSAAYLKQHPRDEVSLEYVRRVLAEIVSEARVREDAETCSRAIQLRWIIDDEKSGGQQMNDVVDGLQDLKPTGIWG